VISSKAGNDLKRRTGVSGRKFFNAIRSKCRMPNFE